VTDPPRRVLFGLVYGLYLLAFPYHPALHSPNELCRLWQTRAIVEHGKLSLNEVYRTYGPVGDLSVYQGLIYPSKAPLLSFAAVPIYRVLKAVGGGGPWAVPELPLVFWTRLFLTVLPTLGLLALLRRFLRAYVPPDVADGVTVTYALGSLAFSYSLLFMSHQTTAVLLFVAFYALWRYLRGEWGWRSLLLAGAASGATVMAEYTGALGVAGLAAYAAIACGRSPGPLPERARKLGRIAAAVALGSAPFLVALMAYHSACFAGPLDSGYKHLADAAYQPWHLGGFLGIKLPSPTAFALSFFSPLRGFFTLAPFLALAVPGLVLQWRTTRGQPERALFWLAALLLLGYAYFTSSFPYESWGWTTGPRHLTPLAVFLLLPVALLLERLRAPEYRLWLGLAVGLCVAAILVTGAVTLVNYIPDNASNALFGLALPLFKDGFLPPSILGFLGLPNPWSGGLLLLALVAAAGLTGWLLTGRPKLPAPEPKALTAPALALGVCIAYFGLMAGLTRHDPGDTGALGHLRSAWMFQPGQPVVPFWPPAPG